MRYNINVGQEMSWHDEMHGEKNDFFHVHVDGIDYRTYENSNLKVGKFDLLCMILSPNLKANLTPALDRANCLL